MLTLKYQIIAAVAILAGLIGYFWYSQATIGSLKEERTSLSMQLESAEAKIKNLDAFIQRQTLNISKLSIDKIKVEEEARSYMAIFQNHDFTMLAREKPGLIESRVNTGTREIFERMMDETSTSTDTE